MSRKRHTYWTTCLACGALTMASALGATHSQAATVRGEIKSFTTAPKGEVDGAVLADDSYVHWPPHMGERVAALVQVGDILEVDGRWENGPEGDRRLEAQQITNADTKAVVQMEPPAGGPRRRPEPRRGETTTRSGRVQELTFAPKGEVDGARLDNGTVLHWPPHLEDRFRTVAAVGAEVRAVGMNETTPRGDAHFEVQSLTNVSSNQTAVGEMPPGAKPRPGQPEAADRSGKIRQLQRQLERMQRELDDLRAQ